jgi:hypothetical protein
VIPERKKSPEAVDPSCARNERANPEYGHQKGMAVGRPRSEMAPSRRILKILLPRLLDDLRRGTPAPVMEEPTSADVSRGRCR